MISEYLYAGTEEVVFDEVEHAYHWRGERLPSVTTVASIKSKGDKLIEWAMNEGERYMLSHWDEESARSEVSRAALLRGMKKAWVESRKYKASVGQEAHEWIEKHIQAKLLINPDPLWPDNEESHKAAESYMEWENNHSVQYIYSEKLVLSKEHRFCGKLDVEAIVDGYHCILDVKTSNAYRSDYALQTAGYLLARNEERRYEGLPPLHDRIILLVSKQEAAFLPLRLPNSRNEHDIEGFLGARRLYSWAEKEGALPAVKTDKTKRKRRVHVSP